MTNEPITDAQLAEWERLADAATPGPWRADDEDGIVGRDCAPANEGHHKHHHDEDQEECPACHGSGIYASPNNPVGTKPYNCPQCDGSGVVAESAAREFARDREDDWREMEATGN